jgi:cytochrome c-type biogenesis protein CcmH/NrfF
VNPIIRVLGITLALCVVLATPSVAEPNSAVAKVPEGWAYELPNYLMSPFCPGKTLSDCTSPQAASLRMWMIVQEAAGRTRADVEAELLERYGDVLRPAPKPEGFGVTAYAFPIGAFLAGGVLVAVFLRRQTRRPQAPPPAAVSAAALDPELERIIDEELAS